MLALPPMGDRVVLNSLGLFVFFKCQLVAWPTVPYTSASAFSLRATLGGVTNMSPIVLDAERGAAKLVQAAIHLADQSGIAQRLKGIGR